MAKEPVEKTIDGEVYTFHRLKVKTSMKLMVKILKILGGALGSMVAEGNAGKKGIGIDAVLDTELDLKDIVGTICERLDEDQVEVIIDTILSQTLHKGRGDVNTAFEELFAGNLPHLFKVVFAAMEVEYGNFFGGGSVLASLGSKAAPESK